MNKNVPKIRFKGFSDEWKKVGFSECVKIKTGQVSPLEVPYCNMPHIGPGNIEKFTGQLLSYNTAKEDNQISGKFSFDKDDIIYGKINPQLGKVAFPRFEGVCSADAYPLLANKICLNNYFLFLYIQTQQFLKYTISVSMRSGMPKINRDELNEFIFKLPSLEEQERIANFLTKVDKLIEKQDEKVSNLEHYKKGMMQKIFSQEVRFKGFNDKWKLQRIGDLIKERNEKTEDKIKFPLYSLTIENGVVPKTDRYEREFLVKKDGNFKIVHKNDFVYNPMNLRFGALASYKENIPVSVSGYYNVFYFNNANVAFWENYLKTERMFYLYNTIATGSLEEKKRVHYSQFKELNLKIPSVEEQTKIANFLSNIDSILEKEKEKLEELRKWKKGLLQGMFV